MRSDSTIKVYSFRVYGSHIESPEVAGYKATREAIQALEGDPIPGTEQSVSPDELDRHGHYRRQPTGWGELS